MKKFLQCLACQLEQKGVKIRNPPNHTCGKVPQPPVEIRTFQDGEKFYAVKYNKLIHDTGKALLVNITSRQVVNGYKVPTGSEIWIPSEDYLVDRESHKKENFIWIKENKYLSLKF